MYPPPPGVLLKLWVGSPTIWDLNTLAIYASWGPIFLETPWNPDNFRAQALNRQLNNSKRPIRGTDDPVTGRTPPPKGKGWPFQLSKTPLIATVALTGLLVTARTELLRDGQHTIQIFGLHMKFLENISK